MKQNTYDLLTKFYGEFSDFRKETKVNINQLELRLQGLNVNIVQNEKKLTRYMDNLKSFKNSSKNSFSQFGAKSTEKKTLR